MNNIMHGITPYKSNLFSIYSSEMQEEYVENFKIENTCTRVKDQNYSCDSNLFSPYFPKAQLKIIKAEGKYVGDFLTKSYTRQYFDDFFTETRTQELRAILIKAQTGKGKNHWVLHVLRPLATERKRKILYLCNRNALTKQQIQEATKAVDPTQNEIPKNDKTSYEIGSITIMTYHQYYELFQYHGKNYFKDFYYCVADEAHFFYADALFNADTENILKSLPIVFDHCFRIYMTATPENVYDLIYWAEWNAIKTGKLSPTNCKAMIFPKKHSVIDTYNSLPLLPVFCFIDDFSSYRNIYTFSDWKNLLKEITTDKSKEKWIVFVNSKKIGKSMESALKESKITSIYIDRNSRSSSDIITRQKWEYLQETGTLGENKVLIATSVLDNGFSVKDKSIGHIVLFSEDKTEFLQELGRVRLAPNQKVKIYISKMTKFNRIHPNTRQSILNLFVKYYGSQAIEEYPYPDTEIKGDPIQAWQWLQKAETNLSCMNIKRVETLNGELAMQPYINNFARWVAGKMKEEADEYEQLLAEMGNNATIEYKLRWLYGQNKQINDFQITNIDLEKGEQIAIKIQKFCEFYLNKSMIETDDEDDKELNKEAMLFIEFSKAFQILYCKINPDDKTINNGKNRKFWKHTAINNHFEKLHKKYDEVPLYNLEKLSQDNIWRLQKL